MHGTNTQRVLNTLNENCFVVHRFPFDFHYPRISWYFGYLFEITQQEQQQLLLLIICNVSLRISRSLLLFPFSSLFMFLCTKGEMSLSDLAFVCNRKGAFSQNSMENVDVTCVKLYAVTEFLEARWIVIPNRIMNLLEAAVAKQGEHRRRRLPASDDGDGKRSEKREVGK